MISCSLSVFLALAAAAPTPQRYAEAIEVYHCGFENKSDINYDAWPDHWIRKTGPGYPKYLPVGIIGPEQISEMKAPEGDRYLQMALDGGAASLSSPSIPVTAQFSYVLETRLRTKKLKGHAVSISLTFTDEQGAILEQYESQRYRDLQDWTKIVVGPIEPENDTIKRVVIGLHLEPGEQHDLFGEALVDDVWLGRLPRMSLVSNSPHNIFTSNQKIEIECRVSGIKDTDPIVTFELVDVGERRLASAKQKLDGDVVAFETARAAEWFNQEGPKVTHSFMGSGVWHPPIEENGYYLVRVTMRGSTGVMHERTMPLAVIEDLPTSSTGVFGWSLPQGEDPLEFGPLTEVLALAGVNWIKFPVWRGSDQKGWGNRFSRFAEQMGIHNIRIVGLLDHPPESSLATFNHESEEKMVAANVFHEAELWTPIVDPIMTRLALNIRWWQIGADNDTSFVGYARLHDKMWEIKEHLERFGQEINLGFGWRWLESPPVHEPGKLPPWSFVSNTQAFDPHTLSKHPAFTGDELLRNLQHQPRAEGARWIVLQPLSRREYATEVRALDLVQRMIAAKIGKADAVFIPNPFDADHGLMEPDGAPSEMLLPWRTTSLTLSETEFEGSIQTPKGSDNRVFIGDDKAVMVIWNSNPVTEELYLGDDVRQIDLWGRVTKPETVVDEKGCSRQKVQVSRLPTFLIGLQPDVARWRMAFHFAQEAVPSVFGRQLPIGYQFKNTFAQGVGGRMEVDTPPEWDVERHRINFKLAPGEVRDERFFALFGLDASSGTTPLRIDFEVTSEKTYKFSVFRTQEVGLGEVEIELTTHLDESGNLVVEQEFTNHTMEFVSFNCILFAPGRRRDRLPVIDLHLGKRKSMFILPKGEELIGQMLYLRAEEIGGARVLSYRFMAVR